MGDGKRLSYGELERRLAETEEELRALQDRTLRDLRVPLPTPVTDETERTEHTKRILLAIRNVNQLIVFEEDPARLIRRACETLSETMGYRTARIVLLDDRLARITATAASGTGTCRLAATEAIAAAEFPACMRRALETEGTVVSTGPTSVCGGCPMAAGSAAEAMMSRALRHGGRTFGVLTVRLPVSHAGDAEERSLFEEMAGDLAFALHRIETTRELSESRRDLERAQALTRVGSWRFDLNTGLVVASAETRRIYGLDGSEWSIPRVQQVPLPEHRAALDLALKGLIGEGRPYDIEFRIRRPSDGAVRYIHSVAEYDRKRRIVVGTIQDITERQLTEEALRESEERNRLLSEVTMEGIVIHRNAVAQDMNQAMARMLGFPREELLGRNFMDFVHPEDRDTVRAQMARAYAAPYTVRLAGPGGAWFHAEIESRDFRHRGIPLRVSAVRDVTDRRALEDRLRQAQKMESVGRLAGGVAHDFNNMLGVILGYSEMALAGLDGTHALREPLQQIHDAAKRSAEITRQLLAFARRQPIAPVPLDLNRTVEGILKMLRRLIGEGIRLEWRPAPSLPPVRMDPSQVDQILANLCVNARDAIEGAGRIAIGTGEAAFDEAACAGRPGFVPGRYAVIEVDDDGCGMDRATLDHIFEPFFTTKDGFRGTGLGLATVYGIVEQNRGFLDVRSEPGRGSTFRVYLPAQVGAVPDAEAPGEAEPRAGDGETVLIVEDEGEILRLTALMLEDLGYAVLTASAAGEAMEAARRHEGGIHLLLTDVILPLTNGKDLARSLRSLRPDLRVLYMSGYTADALAPHGILEPGIRFLQKPFRRADLARAVRRALDDLPEGTG